MRKLRHIGLLCVLAACLLASSCGVSKIKDIALTSADVQYLVPTSTRSVDCKLLLGVNNPGRRFALQEVNGDIRYQDKVLAHFVTGPVEIAGKSEQVYELPCTVRLADGVSLLEVLVISSKRNLQGLKADINLLAALRKDGVIKAPYTFSDVDLSQISKQQ